MLDRASFTARIGNGLRGLAQRAVARLCWMVAALVVSAGPLVAQQHAAHATGIPLADRMILGGGLLIVFVVLAAVSLAMWRELGARPGGMRRARRT